MGFTKLDSGIIHSSIWSEDLATRIVWITILAMKDEHGFVGASMSGLQRASNVTMDECVTAIETLQSPDPDSRTKDYDGRRIEKIDGGWIVLNSDKYRLHSDIAKEKTNERVRRFREKQKLDKQQCNVTETLPSVSVSVSVSDSVSGLNSLEECRETFLSEVQSYTQYTSEMLKEFFEYYSEADTVSGKMLFQKQKVWETGKRLERWKLRKDESDKKLKENKTNVSW